MDEHAAAHQGTRWLTPDEQAAWLALAAVMIKLPAVLDSRLYRDRGLTLFDYLVLAGLSDAPDRTIRMSELAVLANGSLSRLSHGVKRLERRGWVRREPSPEDGRYTNAILTDAGFAQLAAAAPGHVEAVRHTVVDALTATQLRTLREISRRVLARIDADDPDDLPRPGNC